MINSYTRDNESLLDQLNTLIYYFRGALTRDDAFMMAPYEREKAVEFLQARFKEAATAMKNGHQVFI